MAETSVASCESSSPSDDGSYHPERTRFEPLYDSFVCPLTKQIMRDPVALENGQTFEREAIEKWFKECEERRRKPVCPLTLKELRSPELNPSIALRNTIEEWNARNKAVQLDLAKKSLSLGNSDNDILQALTYIVQICKTSRAGRHDVHHADLIPMMIHLLKSSSRVVRCKALETLRVVAEDNADNKEALADEDTLRRIVKFLSHEHSQEREEAVSLLWELSKSESLCEKIGGVNGAILKLVGMTSSKSENILAVKKAEKTLDNLVKCEKNVLQMAENGRLQPLLSLLLEGSPETKLTMASHLGDLVMSSDVKVFVARTVGPSLIDVMRSGDMHAREAALKALNQISSSEVSAKVLIETGILPPLIKNLFTVGINQLPMRLKQVSATILANVVSSGCDFESIPIGPNNQTLVSEDIIHNLLHLISNTGPNIECKLLQVLVGLTSSPETVFNVVSAIKSSGAMISLIQFIEAPQRDLRVASMKLLQRLSPHMGEELANSLCGTGGQLGSLIKVISENEGIIEEQVSAVALLAELPERDSSLARRMLGEGVFELAISKLLRIRQGESLSSRFVTAYMEGLIGILIRLTFILPDEPAAVILAQRHSLAAVFTDLLQSNGLHKVQVLAAVALENLSQESKKLRKVPEAPAAGFCLSIFPCFRQQQVITGLCPVHQGLCSFKESFCLLEGKAVGKLVACLDHTNEKVVEAALAAICTLLDDDVNIEQGVNVLCEAEGIKPILDILLEHRTDILQQRSVWAVERILRTDEIAFEISGDPNVGTALVAAFRNGDYRTRQIAEKALKHVDKIPNFSGVFQKTG